MFTKKAVFFDRDGTLVEAVERPNFPKAVTAPFNLGELKFAPHVFQVLNTLWGLGFLRIMITNQPDVAYGYLSYEDWREVHETIVRRLPFDDVFMCRHATRDGCAFKKPSPLMLLAAADKWGIDLKSSYMIGDTINDTSAGKAAGCKTILIQAPYNKEVEADMIVPNILIASRMILNLEKSYPQFSIDCEKDRV